MKLPHSLRNWTSFLGALLATFSLTLILFLFVLNLVFDAGSSYLGLFIYIILPVFLVIGLVLIPVGMLFKQKKKEITDVSQEKDWPVVDFNDKGIRNASIIFLLGTVVIVILSAVGSYEAFHYTESVQFCGTLCHKVMEPEYVAYHQSSHERVKCVECHVGSGADWYVKSKLSGLYQVYSVTFNKYSRPIETPIHNLRPARETCEECHWPQKFYDHKVKMKRSYLANEETTEWDIQMLMKTSASYNAHGLAEGIHWHINPEVKIEYIAGSANLESIPWVRYTNLKTGEVYTYIDTDSDNGSVVWDESKAKVMDCIDCHNRPSHNYQPPQNFIDDAITAGKISRDIPDIKMALMQVLVQDFESKDSAFAQIDFQVRDYYDLMYPEVLEEKEELLKLAIAAAQEGYSRNIFPYMKVKWSAYPNHLGHLETPGCYRCHNDRHKTTAGRVISRDCNLCHEIKAQGIPGMMEYAYGNGSLEFIHPEDIGDAWKTRFCSDCHYTLY
ncbi:MAG: NapC/NirT family cytochrome c [Bacteroidota bacterium]